MDFLVLFDKWLTRILETIIVALFIIFLTLVCILVILRYGFSTSIFGANELVTITFLFTSAIGGAIGISRQEHIAITYFIDKLPRMLKMACYILGLVLIAVVNAYMIYYSFDWISKAGHNPWQPFGWPQGFVHAAIPIGCGFAVLYCFISIILTLGGRKQIDVLWLPED